MKDFLEIAKITKPHGLKGEMRAEFYSDSPMDLASFETLYLDEGAQPVQIAHCRPNKNTVILKLCGVETVEQAQSYAGKLLYMNRADVELPKDTWFIQDLIGLRALDADTGRCYGIIDEILQNAPVDVYSIRTEKQTQLLFPAIPEVLLSVNIEEGEMQIRPLDGLFDEENLD